MPDFTVSRMQNRRGNLINLPQPLRLGEFGWCKDTGRLFIGGDRSVIPPAIQIRPDIISSVEITLSQQIIKTTVDPTTFVLADFITHMSSVIPESSRISYNGSNVVYVAMTGAQVVAGSSASVITHINAFGASIISAVLGVGFSPDEDGVVETESYENSIALTNLLNIILTTSAANLKANVEVVTEYTDSIIAQNEAADLKTTILPLAASSAVIGANTNGSFDFYYPTDGHDSIRVTYSAKFVTSAVAFREMGKITVMFDAANSQSTLYQESDRLGLETGQLTFTVALGTGRYEVSYINTLPDSVMLRYKIESWNSTDPNYVP